MLKRSFYLLELWVKPGGARKADYYLFTSLEEIKQTLESELAHPIAGGYDVLCAGETMYLMVYAEGNMVWKKGLHPYITFFLAGYPPLRGTPGGRIIRLGHPSSTPTDQDKEMEAVRAFLWNEPAQGSEYQAEIDWAAMDIPELEGQYLEPDEVVTVQQSYSPEWGEINCSYGYTSLEE